MAEKVSSPPVCPVHAKKGRRFALSAILSSVGVWPLKGQDLHAKIFPESQEIPSSKYWEIFHSLSNVMYSVELNIFIIFKIIDASKLIGERALANG